MGAPVWVLSVDLQTKTATFQTGMNDAARSARGAFKDVAEGAKEAGAHASHSMMEARHGVHLVAEGFGVEIPRALRGFIASIGPIGAAMEAAFPFLALIALAVALKNHLHELKEEGVKLTESQERFATVTHNVYSNLEKKLLEAGIRADELNNDHLAALHKQLQLLDHASLEELVKSFETVAKAADLVFENVKTHWYQFDTGAAGAKASLERFKTEYDKLIAEGKNKEASELLQRTAEREEKILKLQKQARDSQTDARDITHQGDYAKYVQATNDLKKLGVGFTEKQVAAQEALVGALQSQLTIEKTMAEITAMQKGNAKTATGKVLDAEGDRDFKRGADEENRANDLAENRRQEAYNSALARLQESEREKIEATKRGSAARLQAIEDAIQEENTKGLQDTAFYRQLLTQKVDTAREMAEEQARIIEQSAREEARHTAEMAELTTQADRQARSQRIVYRRIQDQQLVQEALQAAHAEYVAKQKAYSLEIAGLDHNSKDYEGKLKAIHNRQQELTKQHENKITNIKLTEEERRNQRILSAERQMGDEISSQLTSVIMRHQSFGQMLASIGDQVATGMIQNAIKSMIALDMTKPKEAAAAARKGYLAGLHFPFPANLVMAPALGALSFAAVMAFNKGGLVPGVGNMDSVPAVLTPGEHVSDQKLTQGLTKMVADGGGPKNTYQVRALYAPKVQALDAAGMDKVLEMHADKFQKKLEHSLRKYNGS